MIILLDHNFTLVANSDERRSPFSKQIEHETYDAELIDAIKDHTVILITARPSKYEAETLASIKAKTGWAPAEAYFNTENDPPAIAKRKVMVRHILPRFKPEDMLAIESNPSTRGMYKTLGVTAMKREDYISQPNLFPKAS